MKNTLVTLFLASAINIGYAQQAIIEDVTLAVPPIVSVGDNGNIIYATYMSADGKYVMQGYGRELQQMQRREFELPKAVAVKSIERLGQDILVYGADQQSRLQTIYIIDQEGQIKKELTGPLSDTKLYVANPNLFIAVEHGEVNYKISAYDAQLKQVWSKQYTDEREHWSIEHVAVDMSKIYVVRAEKKANGTSTSYQLQNIDVNTGTEARNYDITGDFKNAVPTSLSIQMGQVFLAGVTSSSAKDGGDVFFCNLRHDGGVVSKGVAEQNIIGMFLPAAVKAATKNMQLIVENVVFNPSSNNYIVLAQYYQKLQGGGNNDAGKRGKKEGQIVNNARTITIEQGGMVQLIFSKEGILQSVLGVDVDKYKLPVKEGKQDVVAWASENGLMAYQATNASPQALNFIYSKPGSGSYFMAPYGDTAASSHVTIQQGEPGNHNGVVSANTFTPSAGVLPLWDKVLLYDYKDRKIIMAIKP